MRPYHSPEERRHHREKVHREAEERIEKLAQTWKSDPDQIAEFLRFSAQFHTYSPYNRMLIYAQNPDAMFAAPFRRYEEMGYYVRKGEHGMRILAPARATYFRKTPQHPWRQYRTASDYEKQQIAAGMLETREELHFKVGTVFDITQTTCPLEDYPKLLGFGYNDAQHADMYTAFCEYSASLGMPVTEVAMGTLTRGKYFPSDGHIEINRALGDTQKLSTVLHETSHGIMQHGSDRTLSMAQVEFEADALSIMLEDKLGLPIPDARVQHLSEHFRAYVDELTANGEVFEPEKAFKQIHEMYDIHESAMQSFFADRGILPQESIVKFKAEPPMEQSITPTPATEVLQTVLEQSNKAEVVRPQRTLSAAQDNYYRLHEIAPSIMQRHVSVLQLRAEGFDSLRMEWIGQNELTVSHARAENGQIFRTPEMVLRVDDRAGIIQPLSYRNDYLKVYREVGVGIDADLTVRRELNQTLNGWLKDIQLRGYRPYDRAAEINEKHHQMWQDVHRYEAATVIDRTKCLVELKHDLAQWQPKNGVTPEQIEQRYSEAIVWAAQQPRIFVDIDGTVANFHKESRYLERMYEQGFFEGLSPYPNAVYGLQDYMIEHPYTEVYTLSATVDSPYCIAEKSAWLDKHLPEIDAAHRIFVPMGENKANYIPGGIRPTDILLDDYNVNLEQWRDTGGYPVKFVNDINDRALHGERFIGDRIHYTDDPVVINAELSRIASGVQGAGNGAELTDDLTKWAQAHADPALGKLPSIGKGLKL